MHFAKFIIFLKSIAGHQISFKSGADFFTEERIWNYEADKSVRAEKRY